MKLGNKEKDKLVEQPLGYWEESSYMMVIPKNDDDNILKDSMERLSSCKEFEIKDTHYDVKGVIHFTVIYEKQEYEVGIYVGGISVPEYYLYHSFLFSEEEKKGILNASRALTIFMKFSANAKESFHLQLKLAMILVPDLIGILDESAEKMLPAGWARMAASSKVLPSSADLFNVQAVNGKDGKVWLHTHGLCRCGITELEILESDTKHYQQHYNLLSTYAMFLLDHKESYSPIGQGAYIGRLINGYPVVVTCIPWVDGIGEYKKLKLGGAKDRKSGHNSKTSIVFLYTSEENENNRIFDKVSIYNELWGDNPLFLFSDEETERMRDVARERFSTVQKAFQNPDNAILIKIGLPLKEKGKAEHIWFELLEVKEDKFKAKLTQEPYDIPDIHTGYEDWYTVNDVTDWIIYTKKCAVNPSNAYLLEEERQ